MRTKLCRVVVAGAIVAALCTPRAAEASAGPKWSTSQLAEFADVVVAGRVEAVASGWDPAVGAIYTYVTIDVSEVLKGAVGGRIVIKQMGGVADGYGLMVFDQATFAVGEEVLVYLETRPRDGTLYTSALWQGKWTIQTTASGERLAVREQPPHDRGMAADVQRLANAREEAAMAPVRGARINVAPVEGPASASEPFALLGPFRWLSPPVVDVQAGGQPGLDGGGISQLIAAGTAWNGAGTGTRFLAGSSSVGPGCSEPPRGDARVRISFMDPCEEIGDSGGTLAIGGAWFDTGIGSGGTNNGQSFHRAFEGFVINNDSTNALGPLTVPNCFQEVELHELGHVLGLGHSSDPAAIMYATLPDNCTRSPARPLAADDVQGLHFIYGGPVLTPPSSAPTNVQVVVNGTTSITVSWNPVSSYSAGAPSAASSYRLDFRQSPSGPILATVSASGTSITIPLPSGIAGTFYVTVTGINSAGAGPSSSPVAFTIGCTGPPPAVSGLQGGVSAGVAFVNWSASAGATHFIVQAGTMQGGANLYPPTNIGASTGASAPVPAGFQAWVRVVAVNACGSSAPADVFIQ